ncbi:MAG TPA: sugar ABC transporter permease [Candidatus Limnocylindrales bacterium]|nr:sugar ABC transporter permease [Candidatus Limnocylindrales bacterium]
MQQRATLSTQTSLAFIAPAFILIGLFLIYPFFSIVSMSFTNQSLTGLAARNPQFVGLENYANLFDFNTWMNKGEFGSSLLITAQFVFGSALIGQAGLGMFIAVLFHRRNDFLRHVVFTLAIIAWITPESVVGFAWFAFLDPFVGTLNRLLGVVGLPGPDWLLNYPLLSIIFFNTWRGAAFSMLLFSSALSSIPHSYLETSQVVGASRWQQFRDILFPLLQTTIATDLILITLWTFNTFTPYLLTGGGPSYQSELISIYTYRIGLQRFEFGQGSAVAVTVMLINLVLASIYLGISRTRKTR